MDSTLQAVLLDLKHCTYSWRQPEPPRWNQNHGKEREIMTTEPLFHLSSVAIRDGRSYDRAFARPVTAKPPTAAAARVEIHALVICSEGPRRRQETEWIYSSLQGCPFTRDGRRSIPTVVLAIHDTSPINTSSIEDEGCFAALISAV